MKQIWSISLGILLISSLVLLARSAAYANGATPAAGTPAADAGTCPVTRSNGDVPPGFGDPQFEGGYGNDALWTNLWMWSEEGVVLPAHDLHVQDDGSIAGLKWAWWRYVPGDLTIDGRRLDGDAKPLIGKVPDGYGDSGFQVSGITFPTPGCWEVTGRVGSASLTFVVWVEVYDPFATPFASPEA